LAQTLVGAGNGKLRQRLDEKYPTAALAVISFDLANWESLSAGAGTLQRFVTPRYIIDDD
jgi:phosphohistidine phosphatase